MNRSIKFPDMFGSASTKIVSDQESTAQNLKTLLMTQKGSFFGDPYFGTNIKRLIFE
jgi:phage baseplate assembly protein W